MREGFAAFVAEQERDPGAQLGGAAPVNARLPKPVHEAAMAYRRRRWRSRPVTAQDPETESSERSESGE
ncbi:hypothetical protein [Streptomyces caniferus]|uniref:hypothetical protein n=1 Tax=Streptomyces caniferus TaxID=285557 RepID=UPI003829F0FA